MADEAIEIAGNDPIAVEHVKTYEGVISMLKWGTAFVAIVLILMALFLVHK